MGKKNLYVDLFSGCGGISLGLYKAGWHGLFAVEKSPMAFETLKHNLIDKHSHFSWPSWLPVKQHNIYSILKKHSPELKNLKGKVDLVTGGPPCQGFSSAGRRNESDSRNKLVKAYIEFIKLVKPRMVFFENVKGFTVGFKRENGRGKAYSSYVEKKLRGLGYDVKAQIVDFANYGVPQRRHRFILVGFLEGKAESFFQKLIERKLEFLKAKGLNETVTLEDAISDLKKENGVVFSEVFKRFNEGIYSEQTTNYQKLLKRDSKLDKPDSHRFPNHKEKTIKRFEFILKNCRRDKPLSSSVKKELEIKKRSTTPLDGKKVCPTLTTLPDDYIHYCEPRILTVREYARIQSFDDWFEFKGKYTTGDKERKKQVPRYTQIGNAVPPLFAELSGKVLTEMRR